MEYDSATLEKIDLIRQRTGVSYRRASEALAQADGDVIEALIALEAEQPRWQERVRVGGSEAFERIREIIHQGNVTRITVRQNGRTLLSLPVTAGAVGALIWPVVAGYLSIAGIVASAAGWVDIDVERRPPSQG